MRSGGRILKFHANPHKLYTIQRAMKNWATFVKTTHGYLLWYAWYGGLNGSDPRKWQKYSKIHNFSKIRRIRKFFSGYSSWRTILHFCFLEYRAITLPCYHMGPWYTTHMAPEWYHTKIDINQLEIDWRVIFESISISFSKWFHYTIIVVGYNHLPKKGQKWSNFKWP